MLGTDAPTSVDRWEWGASSVISADSHAVEPPDLWSTRTDLEFRDRAPRVVSEDDADWWYFDGERAVPCAVTARPGSRFEPGTYGKSARQSETQAGGNDPDARVHDLDLDGVYGEVLYPTIGMYAFRWLPDSALVDAMCRAYNDWLAEFCSAQPARLRGAAMVNVDDVDVAVREVERVAGKGFVAAALPVDPGGGHAYSESEYDPLWAALQDAGLRIGFHLLTDRERAVRRVGEFSTFGGPAATATQPHRVQLALAHMILSGVFERYPRLVAVSAEYEAAWALPFVSMLDQKYKFYVRQAHASTWHEFADGALPSDYFRRNVYLTWQEDELAVPLRSMLGIDRLLWGSDYPHASGTFPKSQEILHAALEGVPADEAAMLVSGNAADLYGFDVHGS